MLPGTRFWSRSHGRPPTPAVRTPGVLPHLNPRPGQVHVGLPLRLHLAVLRRLGVDELLAVRGVQLPGDRALERLGGAGAVEGVRPADGGRQQEGRKGKLKTSLNGPRGIATQAHSREHTWKAA